MQRQTLSCVDIHENMPVDSSTAGLFLGGLELHVEMQRQTPLEQCLEEMQPRSIWKESVHHRAVVDIKEWLSRWHCSVVRVPSVGTSKTWRHHLSLSLLQHVASCACVRSLVPVTEVALAHLPHLQESHVSVPCRPLLQTSGLKLTSLCCSAAKCSSATPGQPTLLLQTRCPLHFECVKTSSLHLS